jgi:hypothetical protein
VRGRAGKFAGSRLGAKFDLGRRPIVHWLAPDPDHSGRFYLIKPHVWPHPGEAHDALEAYRQQLER